MPRTRTHALPIDDPEPRRNDLADALDFGGRAKASYRLALDEPVFEARYHNFCEGENFWQAALEHAERAQDCGALLRINEDIEPLREQALRAVQAGAEVVQAEA